MNIYKEYH